MAETRIRPVAPVFMLLGKTQMKAKSFKDAIESFERALALYVSNFELLFILISFSTQCTAHSILGSKLLLYSISKIHFMKYDIELLMR